MSIFGSLRSMRTLGVVFASATVGFVAAAQASTLDVLQALPFELGLPSIDLTRLLPAVGLESALVPVPAALPLMLSAVGAAGAFKWWKQRTKRD